MLIYQQWKEPNADTSITTEQSNKSTDSPTTEANMLNSKSMDNLDILNPKQAILILMDNLRLTVNLLMVSLHMVNLHMDKHHHPVHTEHQLVILNKHPVTAHPHLDMEVATALTLKFPATAGLSSSNRTSTPTQPELHSRRSMSTALELSNGTNFVTL